MTGTTGMPETIDSPGDRDYIRAAGEDSMATQAEQQSGPVTLGDFQSDCRNLEESMFIERHGEAFLLHHGPVGKLTEPLPDRATLTREDIDSTGDRLFDPKSDFLVFRVRRADDNPDDQLIWAGRSDNNDVVIKDASVSGVHAFFKKDKKGRYTVQDMNSTNGTLVNGEKVPAQGEGPKMELPNGAQVVLGSVRMSFLYAREFISLVERLIG